MHGRLGHDPRQPFLPLACICHSPNPCALPLLAHPSVLHCTLGATDIRRGGLTLPEKRHERERHLAEPSAGSLVEVSLTGVAVHARLSP